MTMIRPSDPDFRICLVDFNTLLEIQSDAERLGFATRWTSVDALRGQAKNRTPFSRHLCGRSGRELSARTGACSSFRPWMVQLPEGWRQSTSIRAPEGADFLPGEQPNEFISRGTVRVPISNILYAGPNPFP
jgi:hypothetical protein